LLLVPLLLLNLPLLGVALLALGTNISALQRLLHVRSQAQGN
jgi:hypothetical protein